MSRPSMTDATSMLSDARVARLLAEADAAPAFSPAFRELVEALPMIGRDDVARSAAAIERALGRATAIVARGDDIAGALDALAATLAEAAPDPAPAPATGLRRLFAGRGGPRALRPADLQRLEPCQARLLAALRSLIGLRDTLLRDRLAIETEAARLAELDGALTGLGARLAALDRGFAERAARWAGDPAKAGALARDIAPALAARAADIARQHHVTHQAASALRLIGATSDRLAEAIARTDQAVRAAVRLAAEISAALFHARLAVEALAGPGAAPARAPVASKRIGDAPPPPAALDAVAAAARLAAAFEGAMAEIDQARAALSASAQALATLRPDAADGAFHTGP